VKIGSLFSGIGGLELGLEAALDGRVVWQVEEDEYCRRVLAKHWPDADRTITDVKLAGSHNLEEVDVICGGFPCQDISVAGKMEGIHGERSGLWFEFQRVLSELRPSVAVLENVPAVTRYSGVITGGLVEIGYDCEWQILSANDMGAPHLRKRWFCIAYLSDTERDVLRDKPGRLHGEDRSTTDVVTDNGPQEYVAIVPHAAVGGAWWAAEPSMGRVADGVPRRVDRLRALGNAVVPQCAYEVGRRVAEVMRDQV
tara:strand:- start:7891 stop:8655 length:765 start_codon:yes stop_codon:yes gene_type:complete